jgi:hypothetical protein
MKVKKYLNPEKEVEGCGPNKSLCTRCKGAKSYQDARFSKLSQ